MALTTENHINVPIQLWDALKLVVKNSEFPSMLRDALNLLLGLFFPLFISAIISFTKAAANTESIGRAFFDVEFVAYAAFSVAFLISFLIIRYIYRKTMSKDFQKRAIGMIDNAIEMIELSNMHLNREKDKRKKISEIHGLSDSQIEELTKAGILIVAQLEECSEADLEKRCDGRKLKIKELSETLARQSIYIRKVETFSLGKSDGNR